jgi:sugar transferase EpsL
VTRYGGYDRQALVRTTRQRIAFDGSKRIVDVAVAAVGLIVLAPVMVGVAIGVRITMGRPIFFKQERVGRHGRRFVIAKFRTLAMDDARCCGEPRICRGLQTPSAQVVGRLARFLRKSGFDEIPQLLAVLRGDMSLIGPRPLLVRYIPRYTPEQSRRHEVLPGITGLAQVNGRTDLAWDDRLALDVYYVDHRSVALDATIAWRTIAAIWHGKGFSREGSGTGPEFLGQGVGPGLCPVTLGPVGSPPAPKPRAPISEP